MKWISVKEKLPDYDVDVLWIDESGHQFIGEIDHDNDWQNFQSWNRDFDNNVIPITHWMPLPKAPLFDKQV